MFERCLICTDFTDGLHRLVHFIPSLAVGGFQQIVFMHAVPLWEEGGIPRVDTEKIEQARARLSAGLQSLPPGIEVKVEVRSGKVLENILEVAKSYQTQLIILGMASQSLVTETLFGSTTMALAQRTPVPLLIFRPQLISAYTGEELDLRCRHLCRYLLIPYNGSQTSQLLLKRIKDYIRDRPDKSVEKCLLCWAIEEVGHRDLPKDYYRQQVQQATDSLTTIKTELERLNLSVEIQVRQGNRMTEIVDAALMSDISAIAIASEQMGNIFQFPSFTSFTADLMRRSWHPVLFLPLAK